MGTFFANPALLLGGLTIAAPIVLFLLTRFRYRTIEWAALKFLERALKKQQRRLRVENLLLLIIRCLVLLLLALALARPRSAARVETKDDVRRNVVLALDTSWSMSYQLGSEEEETAFARARRAAKDIVAGLEAGDRVMVVAFDEAPRALHARPRQLDDAARAELLQDLDDAPELARGERSTDLDELFLELPRLLDRFDLLPDGSPPPEGTPPLKKTVFLLTDAQRRGFLDPSGAPLNPATARAAKDLERLGASLVLVDCGAEEARNVTVTRLASAEPVVGQDLPCHVEVAIRNFGAVDVNDLSVEYFVDGAGDPQKVVSLSVPAGEERAPEALRYVFEEPGPHRVEVVVKSDALVLDNRRTLVLDVRPSVRILLVDGEPSRVRWESETDFLFEVLALSEATTRDGLGLLRPEVTAEHQLQDRRLADYDVVVLANVGAPAEAAVAALEAYVREGGVVVCTLGPMTDAAAWNALLWRDGAGPLPAELLGARGGTTAQAQADRDAPAWAIALTGPEHPTAALFAPPDMLSHLKRPTVFGYWGMGPVAPGVAVPLRLVARSKDDALGGATPSGEEALGAPPLLLERAWGRGRLGVWTTTIDSAWENSVAFDGFYLPFWRQYVLDLTQRARPAVNLPVGGRYERLLRQEEYAAKVEVEAPDGVRESVQLERVDGTDTYRLTFPPDRSGGERPPAGADEPAGPTAPGAPPGGEPASIPDPAGVERSGLYAITREGGPGGRVEAEYFAVVLDPAEGDLARFTAEELQGSLSVPVRPVRHELAREAVANDGGAVSSREYWREVMAALIALLALESVLAAWFGRRRQ